LIIIVIKTPHPRLDLPSGEATPIESLLEMQSDLTQIQIACIALGIPLIIAEDHFIAILILLVREE